MGKYEDLLKRVEYLEEQLKKIQDAMPEKLEDVDPVIDNDRKKKVINKIKSLKRKGATYKEIADYLNTNNIPTLSRSGKWYTQTVHRIYQDL
jgi:phosphotransacetylase